jgi:Carboxypeptidase regulatory-like domain
MKKLILLLLALPLLMHAQTELTGTIYDDSNLPLPDATVKLLKNGSLIKGTLTDENGVYVLTNFDPGAYDLEVSYVGMKTSKMNGLVTKDELSQRIDVHLEYDIADRCLIPLVEYWYRVPPYDPYDMSSGAKLTSDQINRSPIK